MMRWTALLMMMLLAPLSHAQEDAAGEGIAVSYPVFCEAVVDREPVNPKDRFDASTAAFCFTRVFAQEPRVVEHIWYHEGTEKARVALETNPPSWRVWSRKNLYGRRGAWRVDVVDEQGAVLGSARFLAE